MTISPSVIFFDIGGTLGRPHISREKDRLERLDVYPFVMPILEQLQSKGMYLGIISHTEGETTESMQRVLDAAGLSHLFQANLLLYSSVVGLKKDSHEIFQLAAARAAQLGLQTTCLFVGEDSRERHYALQAGLRVCPHPLLVSQVLSDGQVRYVRLTVPANQQASGWQNVLRKLPVIPLHVSGLNGATVYAMTAQSLLPRLFNLMFDVQVLGDVGDPLTNDLYLLRDDVALDTGFLSDIGQSARFFEKDANADLMLSSTEGGLLVKIPSGRSVEDFHFEKAYHGHNLKLVPDPSLLTPLQVDLDGLTEAGFTGDLVLSLSDLEKEELGKITAERILQYLDRYSGKKPLGDNEGTAIKSRHIQNADNLRVINMLTTDLQTIGGNEFLISTHSFTHEGETLSNVVAELPGENSEGVVLITAHLDSTAASSRPYHASQDPAPGADDDGSGVAAVLSAAGALRALATAKKPKQSVRFVLFNAEEHGLVGSQAYARDVAAQGEEIKAVYQLDMIGYNVSPPRSFEVHAGYSPSENVQRRSLILAQVIEVMARVVSPSLSNPQIYRSIGPTASERDPAEGRSDHTPFHQRGYAACLISEDFFIGPMPQSPTPEANPNYHKKTDTFVDADYAADIARCVTAAAWITANPTTGQQISQTTDLKMGSGTTSSGATNWQAYGNNTGVYVDVDTSACGFKSTPKYFTVLGGRSSHWATTGATSIYSPTATTFRVYVRWANGNPLTPAQANNLQWHINWMGMEDA